VQDRGNGSAAVRRVALAAILLVAAAARVAYALQIRSGPLGAQHRWAETDMAYFDAWGGRIAAGDLLSRHVAPPLHEWHLLVAEAYRARYPHDAVPPEGGLAPDASLWDRWAGRGRFYQEPLYAYLLGGVYALFGREALAPIAIQLVLGVVAIGLLVRGTELLLGADVALVAGGIAALYAPLLYFEGLLLRESLIVLAGFALLLAALRARSAGSVRAWLGCGAVLGLAICLKSHFALFGIGLAAVGLGGSPRGSNGRRLGAFALGVALALAPLAARNAAVGSPLLSTSSMGGINFLLGNARDPGADVTDFRASHFAPIVHATEGRFLATVAATVRTHDGPLGWLALLARKLDRSLHGREEADNASFYASRLEAPVLRALPFTFYALGPLGLAGLVLAVPRARRIWPLLLLLLTQLAVPVLFFPRDRFRLPFAACLLPFAALAIVRCWDWARCRRWGALALALGLVGAVALWTGRSLPGGRAPVRPIHYVVPFETYWNPAVLRLEREGDPAAAADLLGRALRTSRGRLDTILGTAGPLPEEDADLALFFAGVRERRAELLARAGREIEAGEERARAAALRLASRRRGSRLPEPPR